MKSNSAAQILHQNTPFSRPVVPKGSHPIETGRYLLATNEIDRMYECVSQWIDNRTPGGIIHGRPRLGKSRAINYLIHTLPTDFGEKLPMFVMNCRQYKTPNEGTFFEDILKDVGHAFAFSGKPNLKRERLYRYFLECAEASGSNRIILFIDDAQRLSELQYNWLMDIYNELDRVGVCLSCILVGQDELLHQRSAFLQAKKNQIVGRFMIHTHPFTGIKKLDDLRSCLIGYDEESEFPLGTGCSFTRYFFPEQFESGFRLESHAEELFETFKELRQEAGMRKAIEIPMQYLTLTIDFALRRYGVNGDDVRYLNKIYWRECITRSGYIEAEIYS